MPARPARVISCAAEALLALLLCGLATSQPQQGVAPLLEVSPPSLSEEALRERRLKEVNLTLSGGSWAAALGRERDATAEWLARAVRGQTVHAHGWIAAVAPHVTAQHVIRTAHDILTLRLVGIDGSGWYPAFDVHDDEAVAIAAPWWAIAENVSATPAYANLTIAVTVPRVEVSGEVIGGPVAVEALRTRPHALHLVLSGGEWALDAGRPGSRAYVALSRALVGPRDVGLLAGTSGWELAASGLLRAERENATHLTLVVPPLPAYRIDSPETVRVTVPAAAMANHHLPLDGPSLGQLVVRATAGRATLGGSLLQANASTRLGPPRVASRALEVRLIGDSWAADLAADDALRRLVVHGIRSAQAEPSGWNALLDVELARDGTELRADPAGLANATHVAVGLGDLALEILDDVTLRLTLPSHATWYAISAPETISVVVPAAALTSASEDIVATPSVRIDAPGGSAVVGGTLIADTLPPTYVNETVRRTVRLELPADGPYGWWAGLEGADGLAVAEALLDALQPSLVAINDTSYDVFETRRDAHLEGVCFNASEGAALLGNVSLANATNGTALNGTLGLNATANASALLLDLDALLANLTNATAAPNATAHANASALLLGALNVTNATANGTSAAEALAAFCLSLVNASLPNGTLIVHSRTYSPYCDPCLRPVTIVPRPLNASAIRRISNASLEVTLPEAARVVAPAANVSVPSGALAVRDGAEAGGAPVGIDGLLSGGDGGGGGGAPVVLDGGRALGGATLRVVGTVHVEHVTVAVPSAVFFGHNDEASLRSPTIYTLDITLRDDAWLPNISSPLGAPGPGMDLLLGIASAQAEPTGWNRIVLPTLAHAPGVLERLDDTTLRVHLGAFPECALPRCPRAAQGPRLASRRGGAAASRGGSALAQRSALIAPSPRAPRPPRAGTTSCAPRRCRSRCPGRRCARGGPSTRPLPCRSRRSADRRRWAARASRCARRWCARCRCARST